MVRIDRHLHWTRERNSLESIGRPQGAMDTATSSRTTSPGTRYICFLSGVVLRLIALSPLCRPHLDSILHVLMLGQPLSFYLLQAGQPGPHS